MKDILDFIREYEDFFGMIIIVLTVFVIGRNDSKRKDFKG